MNISSKKKTLVGENQSFNVDENLGLLKIFGEFNKIKIKSHVHFLTIEGTYNKIDGLDPNCLINKITIKGDFNKINLNRNCINVSKSFNGENTIEFGSSDIDRNNSGNNSNQNPKMQVQIIIIAIIIELIILQFLIMLIT